MFLMKYAHFILVIIILLTSAASYNQSIEIEKNDTEETKILLDIYTSRMQNIINGTIKVAELLEELVILHNGNPEIDEVIRLTELLFDHEIHITIAYAPNGIVEYAYPLEGNKEAIGHRLLEDPITRSDAIQARDTGQATLSRPYILRQGSVATVVRDPIFIEKDGKKEFWGFIAIAMRSTKGLLMNSHIESIEKFNYEYILRYHYNNEAIDILQSKKFDEKKASLSTVFDTKYGEWELSMYHVSTTFEKVKHILTILTFSASGIYALLYSLFILRRKITEKNI